MDEAQAKKIVDYVFEDVFGEKNPFSLAQFKERFAFDVPLPKRVVCALSNQETWSFSQESKKIASQLAITEQFKKDEWVRKKEPINSIQDILNYWQEINYLTAAKNVNSTDLALSDGIYHSSSVYNSNAIFNSQNIIFCYELLDCDYMVASRDNEGCNLGIRMRENINCSSGFEVSWSARVSKSMYLHDCLDLYESLLCSHIRSRKYCVANMQFEKEEYFRIKKMVIDWILREEG